MEVDVPQLQALVAIVDEGSFEAAAASLHVTPSAVSQRIKALERATGQVLVRRSRPAHVTPAGEAYLRLGRQVATLVRDTRAATAGAGGPVTIPLAVSADALATWVLPALATVADRVALDLHREDQDHTAELLRAGTVMAAVTTSADAVQGCRVTPLGSMRYRPVASPAFAERWFPDGQDAASLGVAPVVVFDRKDDLQDAHLRRHGVTARPPRHHVPASADFARAVRLGLGWGMLPDEQSVEPEAAGELVDLEPGGHLEVALHWQQWTLDTPSLRLVSDVVVGAARRVLRQP